MALELYISPCIDTPTHPLHLPPAELPLRIQIEGPLASIQKLFPEIPWPTPQVFPLPADLELARLAFRKMYGREARPAVVAGDMVVRDEYLGWMRRETADPFPQTLIRRIDYYGIIFDHLVPADNLDPEVLQINIIEMDDDGGRVREQVPTLCGRSGGIYWGKGARRAKMLSKKEGDAGSSEGK